MSDKGLGANIAYYRKNKGLSQEKVAEYMNVSRQAVTKWERDISRPSTENLIGLAELFGVSVENLLGKGEGEPEAPEIRPDRNAWLYVGISFFCILGYPFISVKRGIFSPGLMICLFVIAVPMQLFVHLYLSHAVKSGDFSGIAGFSDKVRYHTDEVKRLLVKIDLHLMSISTFTIFLLCAVNCVKLGIEHLTVYFLFLYMAEFVFAVLFHNYGMIDRIYCEERDKRCAKMGFPVTITYVAMLFIGMIILCLLFECKGIENNTAPAMKLAGLLILGICTLTAGFAVEDRRVRKAADAGRKYRPGKPGVLCLVLGAGIYGSMFFV